MVAGSVEASPIIAEIVTVTDGLTPGTPCGGCRQRIREFSDGATRVCATTVAGDVVAMTVDELLPASFGPERLTERLGEAP